MKKIRIVSAAFLLVAWLTSALFSSCTGCSGNKDGNSAGDKTTAQQLFSKTDTAEVMSLTREFLDLLHNKQYEEAVNMLHVYENDSLKALSPTLRSTLIEQQQAFPVLDYSLVTFTFVDEHKVEVVYRIKFFEKPQGSDIPNTVDLHFAPLRINARWYLTLVDKSLMTFHPNTVSSPV